jgi:glycosyltransferase involved in cell wall biosynthesis
MKILIFNTRDIKNPESGGAEVFTHELAKQFVNNGHEVTIISSRYSKTETHDTIDGINIIRVGGKITTYFKAIKYYKKYLKGKFDIIIDEYTTRPYFSIKFAQEPTIFLVHELAREKYFEVLPPILSHIFYYIIEPHWIDRYSKCPTITVSNSTLEDLKKFNYNDVQIVTEGINFTPQQKIDKKENNQLLFVGLIKKTNLIDHIIDSYFQILKEIPDIKLNVIGRGPDLQYYKKNFSEHINFLGYVSDEKKIELMVKSDIVLFPAIREGWGLVVIESNACGTPVIGYNVPGLKDSIINNVTGLLVESNSEAMAKGAIFMLKNQDLKYKMSYDAFEYSKQFTWEKTANKFLEIIDEVVK